MCKAFGVPLTKHHVWEAPLKEGIAQLIMICDDCHVDHNRYTMALRDNKIETDRRKLDS
jgi:hypothetical protein